MDSSADLPGPHHKKLHSKRSFGKYPKPIDSPAYDASEEDNDPLTDDGASVISGPIAPRSQMNNMATANSSTRGSHLKPSRRHQLASSQLLSDSDGGVDSPTYDGDIESSTTAGGLDASLSSSNSNRAHHHHHASSTSTLNTPMTPAFPSIPSAFPSSSSTFPSSATSTPGEPTTTRDLHNPVFISQPLTAPSETVPASISSAAFNPAALTPEDILEFVQKAIEGDPSRKYKINPPPVGRPVRIYADGVYDLFHFGHALQLRQAKLSFPSVHLLVGVCSDEIVKENKFQSVMNHTERCEAARHCRWVDEIVPSAPWIITPEFLVEHSIDYVAHDEEPYAAVGYDDVYGPFKEQGKFLPTRRTPGISTSSLLSRIVSGYRHRDFDDKLVSMGRGELSWSNSRVGSGRASPAGE